LPAIAPAGQVHKNVPDYLTPTLKIDRLSRRRIQEMILQPGPGARKIMVCVWADLRVSSY
jgi:hypothetical protein